MVKGLLKYLLTVGIVFIAACAHEEKPVAVDPHAHLKNDTYEVSASGGDEKLLRAAAGQEAQTVLTGTIKVRGVQQRHVGPLDIHLVDGDGTIYARTKSASDGSFVLSGMIAPGKYTVKIVAKKYRGQLTVMVDKPELKGLVVRVEAMIR